MPEAIDPDVLRQLGAPTSRKAIDSAVLRKLGPPTSKSVSRETTPAATKKPSAWLDFFKSIPSGIVGGAAQTLSAAGQAEALQMGTPMDIPGAEDIEKIMQRATGPLHQPQTLGGKIGASIGRSVADPSTYIGPGGLARKVLTGATGAVGAELGGALTKDSLAGRLLGGVAGGVLPGAAASTARRVAAPTPMRDPTTRAAAVAHLRKEGIEPSAGDVSGRHGVRHAEEMGQRILGGGKYLELKDKPLRQFTQAVTKQMGESVERVTEDFLARSRTRIGGAIERAQKKLPVLADEKFQKDFTAIGQQLIHDPGLPEEMRMMIRGQMRRVLDGFEEQTIKTGKKAGGQRGVMPGTTFVNLTRYDTPLGRATRSTDINIKHYAQQISTALENAMERSARTKGTRDNVGRRQALADLKEARKQWYTMLVAQKAAGGEGPVAARGVILPERMRAALSDTKSNKRGYYESRNYLDKLTRAAAQVLTPARERLGESFSLRQHGVPGSIGAIAGFGLGSLIGHPYIGAGIGSAALPPAVGRFVTSPAGQAWLKRQRDLGVPPEQLSNWLATFLNRPGAQREIAAMLRGGYQGRPREPLRITVPVGDRYGGTDE